MTLRVLLMGSSQLVETLDGLIEFNKKVKLDLSRAKLDDKISREIESSLEYLVNEIKRRQEDSGFLSEADIEELKENAIKMTSKIAS